MNNFYGIICIITLALVSTESVVTQNEYFPGLRKPPSNPNWQSAPNSDLISQLTNFIEEQARRRLQQQRMQQKHPQHYADPVADEMSGPGFTYRLPIYYPGQDDAEPFAVGPSNPKYYENDEYGKDLPPNESGLPSSIYYNILHDNEPPVRLSSDGIPSYKLKAPMDVNPKTSFADNSYESKSKDVLYREDLNRLEVQKKMQEEALANYQHDVLKKHMDLDAAMGMYVIALIAGVSAAVTVGLLAIGIGWYTLQKKAKAAADVEYPAYGVTGPNKDISPSSGDRRLAQSAQMYHYQHQKQQIIAMENQNNGERNGSLSDIETDDENEEGDYTVYECPGLAPTGEMEVKNPLFLDDPTPVVKGTSVTTKSQSHPNQSQQSQSNEKPKNTEPTTKK